MLQGMFGQRLAEHFSLLESSSIVLGPKGKTQVALTRMRMPNGFPGPTPHIPPEKAFSISVHLGRPDSIKGWGTWLDGRFYRVTEWGAGGIQIFDMESEPVALQTSGFDSVHVYIPRFVLNRFSDENGHTRIRDLHCTPGTRDDVILHWARMMLPFSDRWLQLPRLVIDEMIMMLCAHLTRTYQDPHNSPEVVTGGLAVETEKATWHSSRGSRQLSRPETPNRDIFNQDKARIFQNNGIGGVGTMAFFEWRARAGACHEMMSNPERSLQPDDKAPIRREWRTNLCWHPARIWKRE